MQLQNLQKKNCQIKIIYFICALLHVHVHIYVYRSMYNYNAYMHDV